MEVKLLVDWDGDGTFQSDEDIWPAVIGRLTARRGTPFRVEPFAPLRPGQLACVVRQPERYLPGADLRPDNLQDGDTRLRVVLQLASVDVWRGYVTKLTVQTRQSRDVGKLEATGHAARITNQEVDGDLLLTGNLTSYLHLSGVSPISLSPLGALQAGPASLLVTDQPKLVNRIRLLEALENGRLFESRVADSLLLQSRERRAGATGAGAFMLGLGEARKLSRLSSAEGVRNSLQFTRSTQETDVEALARRYIKVTSGTSTLDVFSGFTGNTLSQSYTYAYTNTRPFDPAFFGYLAASLASSAEQSEHAVLHHTVGTYQVFKRTWLSDVAFTYDVSDTAYSVAYSATVNARIEADYLGAGSSSPIRWATPSAGWGVNPGVVNLGGNTPRISWILPEPADALWPWIEGEITYISSAGVSIPDTVLHAESASKYGSRRLDVEDIPWATSAEGLAWADQRLDLVDDVYWRGKYTLRLTSALVSPLNLGVAGTLVTRDYTSLPVFIEHIAYAVGRGGEVYAELTLTSQQPWTGRAPTRYVPPQPPQPTTVNAFAGADVTVESEETATLLGSAAVANGIGATTYAWVRISGAGGSLNNSNIAQPVFTAPDVTADRDIVYRLTATNNGVSDSDDVTITVVPMGTTPPPPTGAYTAFAPEAFDFGGNAKVWIVGSDQPAIPGSLMLDGIERTLSLIIISPDGSVELDITGNNSRFITSIEDNAEFTFTLSDGTSATAVGITDMTEPYDWIPTNASDFQALLTHLATLSDTSITFTISV